MNRLPPGFSALRRGTLALLGLLTVSSACGHPATQPPSQEATTAMTQDASALFGPNPQPLLQGDSTALTDLELRASDSDFRGLALAAPSAITAAQAAVPVVILSQRSALRAWQVTDRNNLRLAISNTDTGAVTLMEPLRDEKDADSVGELDAPRPPQPTGSMAEALSTKAVHLDAGLLAQSGTRVTVTALAFDWKSNTVSVTRTGAAPVLVAAKAWQRPAPDQGLPSYLGTATPPATGLTFTIQAQSGQPRPGGIRLSGQFAKPAVPGDLLARLERIRDNGADQSVTALVPLALVVARLDGLVAGYPLNVPVYGAAAPQPGQPVNGSFRLDYALSPAPSTGHYAAYLFMDGTAYGPQLFDIP